MLVRKCARCGREIEVSLPYSKKYIYYKAKGKWFHYDCFVESTSSRVNIKNWIDKTSDFVLSEVSKDDMYQFFFKHYDVCSIPIRIYKKFDQIYKGTYKGLAQPIPPNELFDIIKQKDDYLFQQFRLKGIDGERRIDYALAVAISSYKSYKAWRTKIESEQAEITEHKKQAEENPNKYKLWGNVKDIFKREEELIDYEETLD